MVFFILYVITTIIPILIFRKIIIFEDSYDLMHKLLLISRIFFYQKKIYVYISNILFFFLKSSYLEIVVEKGKAIYLEKQITIRGWIGYI